MYCCIFCTTIQAASCCIFVYIFYFLPAFLSYVQKPYFTNELLFGERLATRQLILQLKSDLKNSYQINT